MKFYCIHHKPANDRKLYIESNIKLENIVWIEEYHPLSNFIDTHPKIYCEHSANRSFLNNAELSCYYKHLLAISDINNSQDYGFVFEDDIEKPGFELSETLMRLKQLMEENYIDILFVGSFADCDLRSETTQIFCNESTLKSRCAHAYIISPNKSQIIIEYINNIKAPFDWQLNYAIKDLNLKSCWSYPHIYQRTEKNKIASLLR